MGTNVTVGTNRYFKNNICIYAFFLKIYIIKTKFSITMRKKVYIKYDVHVSSVHVELLDMKTSRTTPDLPSYDLNHKLLFDKLILKNQFR